MANGHGGYRKPEHPAPTSPPGALSRRTDGGPAQPVRVAPGGEYGSRQEMTNIQSSAPMAAGGAPTPGSAPAGPTPADLIPLSAPSARPDEPVTAGAELGPGIGPVAAGIKSDAHITNEQLRPLVRSMELVANLPGSNPEFRSYVRALKARLSNG